MLSQSDTLNLSDNGFSVRVFNSELTFVLDETGGLACRPLYIIIIVNDESEVAYRLTNVCFFSQCVLVKESFVWSDALGAAESLAKKIQLKNIISLSYWQEYAYDKTTPST